MPAVPYRFNDSGCVIQKYISNRRMLSFLVEDSGRTLSQSAIKFCLSEPSIISVLPNITNIQNLNDYILSSDSNDLLESELFKIEELWRSGFEVK